MDCIHSIEYHVLPQEALAEVPFLSGCRKLLEYMAPTLYDEFDLAIPKLDIKLKILDCRFLTSYLIIGLSSQYIISVYLPGFHKAI